jgi:sugar phosphate isomerase/epimerase
MASQFTYCLNTATIMPTPLMEKIPAVANAGFQMIELWINDIIEYTDNGGAIKDVTQSIADHGMTVPSCIALKGWVEASEAEYPAALDAMKARMNIAAQVGSTWVVATPSREPCDLSLMARRYRDLLDAGREIGVMPTMEYIGFFRSVYQFKQAWQIVVEADDPDGTVILDAFHNFRGDSPLSDLDVIPVDRISHYHFDDAPADPPRTHQADPNRVMPGDGIIDLHAEIQFLRDKNYTGPVSLELFNRAYWKQDPNEVLKLGMERMQRYLES